MPYWRPYVSVARRRANALREMSKLRKEGRDVEPVAINGRTIALSFWGKAWCDHLESFSDFANRLPRGRTYARNGSVCHLAIKPSRIEAIVSGSELYDVTINIKKLKPTAWQAIKKQCTGQIGSMLELLQGKLSDQVMTIVANRDKGLFPQPGEIEFRCSCPDWADMCKHVAAVLYGVGNRLDSQPDKLFLLRDVDAEELITTPMVISGVGANTATDALANDQLSDLFGIDLDNEVDIPDTSPKQIKRSAKSRATTKTKSRKTRTVKPPVQAKRKQAVGSSSAKKVVAGTKPVEPLPRIRPTGRSIARLRKQLNLSVAEFAAQLGVAPASVYRWESTTERLSLQERPLRALARMHQQAKNK